MHHPPRDGEVDLIDNQALFDIVLPHQSVKAIFYGHTHVYRCTKKDHVHLVNLPATGYAFRDDQPVGWIEATFTKDKGEFVLHTVGGDEERDGEKTDLMWG